MKYILGNAVKIGKLSLFIGDFSVPEHINHISSIIPSFMTLRIDKIEIIVLLNDVNKFSIL
jgi:hypothetical protein